jgi:hypothetical protein
MVVKRLALALLPLLAVLLLPRTAVADDQPFKTVVDTIVPKTAGLTIEGSTGGCDLLLQNQTGQDLVLFDTSKPPKPLRFAAKPKSASPPPPVPVHLTGAWPCASLPAVTEDHSWNHAEVTVGSWSLLGTVGAISFKLTARTLYDPALDPSAEWTLYLRLAIGAGLVGGLLIVVPYLVRRRLEILGNSKKAR